MSSSKPTRRSARWTVAALAAMTAAGCAATDRASPQSPAPPAPGIVLPPALVEAVRADAVKRSGASPDAVRIDRVEAVTWRDGSLGCPQPDRLYTQALVPGWRVAVTAGPQTMVYHASRRGGWLWCPPGRAQDPLPGDAAI